MWFCGFFYSFDLLSKYVTVKEKVHVYSRRPEKQGVSFNKTAGKGKYSLHDSINLNVPVVPFIRTLTAQCIFVKLVGHFTATDIVVLMVDRCSMAKRYTSAKGIMGSR